MLEEWPEDRIGKIILVIDKTGAHGIRSNFSRFAVKYVFTPKEPERFFKSIPPKAWTNLVGFHSEIPCLAGERPIGGCQCYIHKGVLFLHGRSGDFGPLDLRLAQPLLPNMLIRALSGIITEENTALQVVKRGKTLQRDLHDRNQAAAQARREAANPSPTFDSEFERLHYYLVEHYTPEGYTYMSTPEYMAKHLQEIVAQVAHYTALCPPEEQIPDLLQQLLQKEKDCLAAQHQQALERVANDGSEGPKKSLAIFEHARKIFLDAAKAYE